MMKQNHVDEPALLSCIGSVFCFKIHTISPVTLIQFNIVTTIFLFQSHHVTWASYSAQCKSAFNF